MTVVIKEVKAHQTDIKIYYTKGFFRSFGEDLEKAKEAFDETKYEMVCHYPIWRAPNHSDHTILESLFELFNWVHEGFQPEDKELGFYRPETVYHTSMSVGDVVDIEGTKYLCDSFGWVKLRG